MDNHHEPIKLVLANRGPKSGQVQDEAMRAGRTAASFPAATEDYFAAMDNGAPLNADQIKGRNMWLVWTGGNDRFWDVLIKDSFGTFDLLKTISSAPGSPFSRDNRWTYFGVVNEPCFDGAFVNPFGCRGARLSYYGRRADRREAASRLPRLPAAIQPS